VWWVLGTWSGIASAVAPEVLDEALAENEFGAFSASQNTFGERLIF